MYELGGSTIFLVLQSLIQYHVAMTPNHKVTLLLLRNCNVVTVTNCNVDISYIGCLINEPQWIPTHSLYWAQGDVLCRRMLALSEPLPVTAGHEVSVTRTIPKQKLPFSPLHLKVKQKGSRLRRQGCGWFIPLPKRGKHLPKASNPRWDEKTQNTFLPYLPSSPGICKRGGGG